MEIDIKINEGTIRQLVADYLSEKTGQVIEKKDVFIEVKSKQNYKAEWEVANFRAHDHKFV